VVEILHSLVLGVLLTPPWTAIREKFRGQERLFSLLVKRDWYQHDKSGQCVHQQSQFIHAMSTNSYQKCNTNTWPFIAGECVLYPSYKCMS